jgi:hypothetical protein
MGEEWSRGLALVGVEADEPELVADQQVEPVSGKATAARLSAA